jgi:3'(2'), 5'-bisphosphate nucleotidase
VASAHKLLQHPEALCNMVRRLVVEAGDILLDYNEGFKDPKPSQKEDGSWITCADNEAEEFLIKGLSELVEGVPIIAEEQFANGLSPSLEGHEYFWMVDPLDGTASFVKGEAEFTINVALIHNSQPILGVIYAPAKGEMYSGAGENTALRWLIDADSEKNIQMRRPPAHGLVITASRSSGDKTKLGEFLEDFKVSKMVRCSSALKFCLLASGKADLYPRFGRTCEWDVAAGHAILLAAGGKVTNFKGEPITYGHAGRRFVIDEFIAGDTEFLFIEPHEDKLDDVVES